MHAAGSGTFKPPSTCRSHRPRTSGLSGRHLRQLLERNATWSCGGEAWSWPSSCAKHQPNGEVGFWANFLRTKGSNWKDQFRTRLSNSTPFLFEDLLRATASRGQQSFRSLDVGAGPMSCCGLRLAPPLRHELVSADPMAREYVKSLDKYGVVSPAPLLNAPIQAEALSGYFGEGAFDLTFTRNAVDHTLNPLLAIREMIRVTKPGGLVVLEISEFEGEKQRYDGLHQWNFVRTSESGLLLWRPEGARPISVLHEFAAAATPS